MFAVSESLQKADFVSLYSDVVLLSSLLVVCTIIRSQLHVSISLIANYDWSTQAPFGLPDHVVSIFQQRDYVVNELLPTYRQCEEFMAKRLFSIRGVSDDVIAATMHKLVEEKHDPEVKFLYSLFLLKL